jgi:ABC-type Fe3+-hydroxamate transport system substrate-binding protein
MFKQGGTGMKKILLLLMAALVFSALPAVTVPTAEAADYMMTVLNPQGPVDSVKDLAPRLGTLKGKKIAMWLSATPDQLFAGKGTELFDRLEKMLRDAYPGIDIVPYKDLPMKFAPENEIVEKIVAARPDGVVAGFGG